MTTAIAPAITITPDGQQMAVRFDQFGLDAYETFLRAKAIPESDIAYDWETDTYTLAAPARFAMMLGVAGMGEQRERLPLSPHLFDFQRFCVGRALDAKRFALWADTGLGKSHMILEWVRQVQHLSQGKVLIIEPLAVISQLLEIAGEWFGMSAIQRLSTRDAVIAWCEAPGAGVGITNSEKWIEGVMPEMRRLSGVAFDESSRLKGGGGVIKWNLIKSCRGIEYKLSATATPAPNEAMEYASQASWLEKLRSEGDIIFTYFSKNQDTGEWSIKPHAKEAFYKFMASWSVYMRDPAHFGFEDILASLPKPEIREYQVAITDQQRELAMTYRVVAGKGFFDDRIGVTERSKLSQRAKGFLYGGVGRRVARIESNKPAFCADLVRRDLADGFDRVLVWTVFDAESDIIAGELGDAYRVGVLDGSMSDRAREETLNAFKAGEVHVLVSKPSLIGFGLNLQYCRSMVFSGFDDSFERMYQAVRRCLRFGQTGIVRVHVPYVPELEGMIFTNVREKEENFMRDVAIQEAEYRSVLGLA